MTRTKMVFCILQITDNYSAVVYELSIAVLQINPI